MKNYLFFIFLFFNFFSCKKNENPPPLQPPPASLSFNSFKINGQFSGFTYYNINTNPVLKFSFSAPLNRSTIASSVYFRDKQNNTVAFTTSYENNDSSVIIQPSSQLSFITKYTVTLSTALKSAAGGNLLSGIDVNFTTQIDSSRKFPLLTDNALLDLVQQQTFKYFWDFAHPVSGLARERNTSGDIVTSGGSGFGIMAIIAAVNRGFITKAQALTRMQTMVAFLKNTAQKFHGAFPHWLNGNTGVVVPFSTKDNGADLVETSYLIQGLLCARQFFNEAGTAETTLRNDINSIYNGVEWNWFR
ncbi:MAG: Ig-like domain-containing protein, partial [Chitinophagaceae bacterium]